MKAKNKVIAGDYNDYKITTNGSYGCITKDSFLNAVAYLNKRQIESYDLITEETMKSGTSAILRGMAGVALLGGVGILAGLSAKNKGIYTIAIQWKDGKKSLIEIDDKLYKKFVADMF